MWSSRRRPDTLASSARWRATSAGARAASRRSLSPISTPTSAGGVAPSNADARVPGCCRRGRRSRRAENSWSGLRLRRGAAAAPRLQDLAGLEAAGADADVADLAVHVGANRPEVGERPGLGLVVRVGDLVPDERTLAADVTTTSHDVPRNPKERGILRICARKASAY